MTARTAPGGGGPTAGVPGWAAQHAEALRRQEAGEPLVARRAARAAVAVAADAGERAESRLVLAWVSHRLGEDGEAAALIRAARPDLPAAAAARADCLDGLISCAAGRYAEAADVLASAAAGLGGDARWRANALVGFGVAAGHLRRFAEADAALADASGLYTALGEADRAATCAHNRGFLAAEAGDHRTALDRYAAAGVDERRWPEVLVDRAKSELALGLTRLADATLARAEAVLAAAGRAPAFADALLARAEHALNTGDPDTAARTATTAADLFRAQHRPTDRALAIAHRAAQNAHTTSRTGPLHAKTTPSPDRTPQPLTPHARPTPSPDATEQTRPKTTPADTAPRTGTPHTSTAPSLGTTERAHPKTTPTGRTLRTGTPHTRTTPSPDTTEQTRAHTTPTGTPQQPLTHHTRAAPSPHSIARDLHTCNEKFLALHTRDPAPPAPLTDRTLHVLIDRAGTLLALTATGPREVGDTAAITAAARVFHRHATLAACSGADTGPAAAEFARLLRLPARRIVLVPTPALAGLPWALLPGGITVAPSVAAHRRAKIAPVVRGPRLWISGPGLEHAEAEVTALHRVHGGTLLVEPGVEVARSAIERAGSVHIAAHGHHRAGAPGIELGDGALHPHHLSGLRRVPGRVVLAACEVGHPYGFPLAFLRRGARAVVGSPIAVRDRGTRGARPWRAGFGVVGA